MSTMPISFFLAFISISQVSHFKLKFFNGEKTPELVLMILGWTRLLSSTVAMSLIILPSCCSMLALGLESGAFA